MQLTLPTCAEFIKHVPACVLAVAFIIGAAGCEKTAWPGTLLIGKVATSNVSIVRPTKNDLLRSGCSQETLIAQRAQSQLTQAVCMNIAYQYETMEEIQEGILQLLPYLSQPLNLTPEQLQEIIDHEYGVLSEMHLIYEYGHDSQIVTDEIYATYHRRFPDSVAVEEEIERIRSASDPVEAVFGGAAREIYFTLMVAQHIQGEEQSPVSQVLMNYNPGPAISSTSPGVDTVLLALQSKIEQAQNVINRHISSQIKAGTIEIYDKKVKSDVLALLN